jgi:hypothetical protein
MLIKGSVNMKTVLYVLLALVVMYVICLAIGFVGCLYDGSLGFRDGHVVALDANGHIIKPKPQTKPTAEQVEQIRVKYKEERKNKASWFCFAALGCFILGFLTAKPQFHTVGLVCLFGALVYDYHVLLMALFLWYIIVPALVIMGIIGLFKRS